MMQILAWRLILLLTMQPEPSPALTEQCLRHQKQGWGLKGSMASREEHDHASGRVLSSLRDGEAGRRLSTCWLRDRLSHG